MKIIPLVGLTIITAVLFAGCDKFTGQVAVPPSITAQGFKIDTAQEGEVGRFGSLRVRIEAPAGIEKLQITERSYEVDLATTPERDHFDLFDLDRRVMLNKDVTLDFQNYINRKLTQPGDFTLAINVTDKNDRTAQTNIVIRLAAPTVESTPTPSTHPEADHPEADKQQPTSQSETESLNVKTGRFEINRIGTHEIEGDETFGLAWKTIDPIHVTIRVRKKESGASKLARFSANDYDSVDTQASLEQMLALAEGLEHIDFNTANNAALGKVLGVINSDKVYLLKSTQSSTALSDMGTTVTLTGEYKYR